jgi:hypothetical protein
MSYGTPRLSRWAGAEASRVNAAADPNLVFTVPGWSRPPHYAFLRFELARKNSQKALSSIVPAASSRMACAAASSLAVKR